MKWKDFVPDKDERMFICGQSGSGKTTLIQQVLRFLPKKHLVIIFDSKHDWPMEKDAHGRKPEMLKSTKFLSIPGGGLKEKTYIYRPEYPEFNDPRNDAIFLYALRRKDCTLVIDELGDFSRGVSVHPALGKVIRQGRSRHVRMLIGSQRPSQIPLIAITESRKVACFYLKNPTDRKRMAEWCNPAMIGVPDGEHSFWWQDDRRKLFTLVQGGQEDHADHSANTATT